MAGTGRATVREAVAVFEDVGELEATVADLEAAGFAEDAFSLLAADEAVERKLGHVYRRGGGGGGGEGGPPRGCAAPHPPGGRAGRGGGGGPPLPGRVAAGPGGGSAGPP